MASTVNSIRSGLSCGFIPEISIIRRPLTPLGKGFAIGLVGAAVQLALSELDTSSSFGVDPNYFRLRHVACLSTALFAIPTCILLETTKINPNWQANFGISKYFIQRATRLGSIFCVVSFCLVLLAQTVIYLQSRKIRLQISKLLREDAVTFLKVTLPITGLFSIKEIPVQVIINPKKKPLLIKKDENSFFIAENGLPKDIIMFLSETRVQEETACFVNMLVRKRLIPKESMYYEFKCTPDQGVITADDKLDFLRHVKEQKLVIFKGTAELKDLSLEFTDKKAFSVNFFAFLNPHSKVSVLKYAVDSFLWDLSGDPLTIFLFSQDFPDERPSKKDSDDIRNAFVSALESHPIMEDKSITVSITLIDATTGLQLSNNGEAFSISPKEVPNLK
jgi:hypothetical protein